MLMPRKKKLPAEAVRAQRKTTKQPRKKVAQLATDVASPPTEPLGIEPAGITLPGDELPDETILRTRAEAAEYFGVDERTVAKWLTQHGFPGNAGTRGQRNGYFPAQSIAAWRDGRRRVFEGEDDEDLDGGKNFEQAGLIRAKRQLAELDLAERTAELVHAEEVTSRMVRLAAEAAAVLRQLPAEMVAQMPEDIDPETIAHMRELARLRVEQALRCLAEAARSVAGEEEYDDEADAATSEPAPAPERPPAKAKPKPKPKPRSKPRHRAAGQGRGRQRAAKRK